MAPSQDSSRIEEVKYRQLSIGTLPSLPNAGILSVLDLCMSQGSYPNPCEFACASTAVTGKHRFLGVILQPWLLEFFCLHLWVSRGWVKEISFKSEYFGLLLSLHCLLTDHVSNYYLLYKASLTGLSDALVYGYSNMSSGVTLLLRSFSRIIVLGIPVGPTTYLVSCSWPLEQCHVWVSSHGVDLKFISFKKWLVTPMTSVPPLHHYILQADLCCGLYCL